MSDGPQRATDLIGTTLCDRYRVLSMLGSGGMGTVFLAEHVNLRRRVAIKVLRPKSAQDQLQVQRFMREARATSAISHPNVIEISDFGDTPDGTVFFVMECLDGEDLRRLLKREKRLAWPRVRHLIVQVCRALEAAHAAGVVHRDMKPDNCFRITRGDDPDFIKVLDFGIAKTQPLGPEDKGLTKTGIIVGTAEYMSPEQIQGNSFDPRVDVYAVGVIMYELLCGRVPFRDKDKNFAKVLIKQLYNAPRPPSQRAPDANIPPEAEAIVLKSLAKDPANRFASMTEMIAAIEAVGTGAPAVTVVAEHVIAPDTSAPMHYSESLVAPVAGTQEHDEAGSSRVLWIGVGGLIVAAGLAAFAVLGETSSEAPADAASEPQDPPAVAAAPEQPAPTPTEAAAPEPTPAATSTLHFDTNVPVSIHDATDGTLYGRSDDPAGIAIPRSSDPVALLLRADGYDEQRVEVVPNTATKRYSFELLASDAGAEAKPKQRSGKAKSKSSNEAAAKPEAPDAEDIGLLNPFKNKQP